jgi:hypothetical protein
MVRNSLRWLTLRSATRPVGTAALVSLNAQGGRGIAVNRVGGVARPNETPRVRWQAATMQEFSCFSRQSRGDIRWSVRLGAQWNGHRVSSARRYDGAAGSD